MSVDVTVCLVDHCQHVCHGFLETCLTRSQQKSCMTYLASLELCARSKCKHTKLQEACTRISLERFERFLFSTLLTYLSYTLVMMLMYFLCSIVIFFLFSGTAAETRGTAFVVYEDIFDAKNACDHLSGFNVCNRYLVVLYYQPNKMFKKLDKVKKKEELDSCLSVH